MTDRNQNQDREPHQRGSQASRQQKAVGQHGTGQRRSGEDFGKDKSQPDGDADNPSETTGATESGNEDQGAKR